MSDQAPKLSAYIVALSFAEDGPLHVSTWVADRPEAASALAMHALMLATPAKVPLKGVAVATADAALLRQILRQIEGGGSGSVVSLVQNTPGQTAEVERPMRGPQDFPLDEPPAA